MCDVCASVHHANYVCNMLTYRHILCAHYSRCLEFISDRTIHVQSWPEAPDTTWHWGNPNYTNTTKSVKAASPWNKALTVCIKGDKSVVTSKHHMSKWAIRHPVSTEWYERLQSYAAWTYHVMCSKALEGSEVWGLKVGSASTLGLQVSTQRNNRFGMHDVPALNLRVCSWLIRADTQIAMDLWAEDGSRSLPILAHRMAHVNIIIPIMPPVCQLICMVFGIGLGDPVRALDAAFARGHFHFDRARRRGLMQIWMTRFR